MNIFESFNQNLRESDEIEKKEKEYTDYIEEHRNNVKKAWNEIKTFDNPFIQENLDEIEMNIENHDLDKYDDDIFDGYRKKYYPINDEESEEVVDSINDLFRLHYSRNPHHWEYWLNEDGEPDYTRHSNEQIDTDIMISYIEMLCDWASFGVKKNDKKEIREWYISHKPTMKLFQAEQEVLEDLMNQYVNDELKESSFKESKAESYYRELKRTYWKLVEANPDRKPEDVKLDSSTYLHQEDTSRTFYDVIRLAEKSLKGAKIDLKLDVINEDKARQIELENNAVIKYCEDRIARVKRMMNESDKDEGVLNPKLFQDNKLIPEVRDKLIDITNEFIDNFNIELSVDDINIVGSNAGYNYKETSDIDLHIITDYNSYPADVDIVDELFNAKKNNFNSNYDITIKDLPVEVYIEDSNAPAESNGRYSIVSDTWLQEPIYIEEPEVNEELVKEYSDKITKTIKSKNVEEIDSLIDEIWNNRKESVRTDGFTGEFNLVFKKLRADGLLDKLRQSKIDCTSEELSI